MAWRFAGYGAGFTLVKGQQPFLATEMKAYILPVSIVLFLLALGAVLWVYGPQPGARQVESAEDIASAKLELGGAFTLTDQHGNRRTDADFAGRFRLIYFGYSFCPDICPTDMMMLSQVLDGLGNQRKDVAAMFITVDPERDTPEHLATVMANFHPDMLALTGTKEQVESVKKAYKVYSAKATPDGTMADYLVDHSTLIYLMGPDGRYITHFNHGTPSETVLDRLNRELARHSKEQSVKDSVNRANRIEKDQIHEQQQ